MNKDVLDMLNVISFVLSLLNYGENLTQSDKDDLMEQLDAETSVILTKIEQHLARQDAKLEELCHDIRRDLCKNCTKYDKRDNGT